MKKSALALAVFLTSFGFAHAEDAYDYSHDDAIIKTRKCGKEKCNKPGDKVIVGAHGATNGSFGAGISAAYLGSQDGKTHTKYKKYTDKEDRRHITVDIEGDYSRMGKNNYVNISAMGLQRSWKMDKCGGYMCEDSRELSDQGIVYGAQFRQTRTQRVGTANVGFGSILRNDEGNAVGYRRFLLGVGGGTIRNIGTGVERKQVPGALLLSLSGETRHAINDRVGLNGRFLAWFAGFGGQHLETIETLPDGDELIGWNPAGVQVAGGVDIKLPKGFELGTEVGLVGSYYGISRKSNALGDENPPGTDGGRGVSGSEKFIKVGVKKVF